MKIVFAIQRFVSPHRRHIKNLTTTKTIKHGDNDKIANSKWQRQQQQQLHLNITIIINEKEMRKYFRRNVHKDFQKFYQNIRTTLGMEKFKILFRVLKKKKGKKKSTQK